MIAFDADVLTDILAGNSALCAKAGSIPPDQQAVPIIVIEEIIRGRLNAIRLAEAGKSKHSLSQAYALFDDTLNAFRQVLTLPYSIAVADIGQASIGISGYPFRRTGVVLRIRHINEGRVGENWTASRAAMRAVRADID